MASLYRIASGWRAQIRMRSRPAQSKVFPTKAAAVAWAREQEAAPVSKGADLTFADILETYSKHSRPGGPTKQYSLRRLHDHWGSWRLSEIHTGAVTDFVTLRRRRVGPASVLGDLIYMTTVLKHGGVMAGCDAALIARDKVSVAMTTLRHVGLIGDSEERSRRPSPDELERMAPTLSEMRRSPVSMLDIVLFAICSCCRQNEILKLKWSDLDSQARTIWVRKRKHPRLPGGRDDQIPLLVGPVTFAGNVVDPLEIILRQKRSSSGRIFPVSTATVKSRFAEACQVAGVEDLRFHDLRHEGVSRLFEHGLDIPQVSLVSGHRSWKNLQRYTHLRPDKLRLNVS